MLHVHHHIMHIICSDKSKKLFTLNIEILALKRKFEFSWNGGKKTLGFNCANPEFYDVKFMEISLENKFLFSFQKIS